MDLTPHRDELRRLSRTDSDPRVRHRADGLLLLAGGLSGGATARRLGCAPNSRRRWGNRYLAEGREGLADQARRGRPAKLPQAARDLLDTALAASPLDYDYPVTTWTVADLTDLLAQRGWIVHPVTVSRTLHALGYRSRRPRHDLTHDPSSGSRSCGICQACLTETAKKGARAGSGFRLVDVDACAIHTHPHLAKVWQRRGQRMIVPAAGQDQRRSMYGALDYASGAIVSRIAPQKNGEGFATFLAQIAKTWPTGDIVLVLDNVSYHRGQAMKDWWKQQDARITPFWLPVYCPNLNLIERVWRWLKQKVACHRVWNDVESLQATAETLLDGLTTRFHADDGPSLVLHKDFCNSA